MRNVKRQSGKNKAFTIVELLTVMSIIIVLLSLLVPGLQKARTFAKKVKQGAQFHSIEVALDMFNAENEGYPDSAVLPNAAGTDLTTGAHRLAEALVGRDLQGYDPLSSWDAKFDEGKTNIYGRGTTDDVNSSLERRKGPYLKLDNAASFQACQLYSAVGTVYPGQPDPAVTAIPYVAPVLTDVYQVKTVMLQLPSGGMKAVKAGSPILYYKANVSSKVIDSNYPAQSIFNSLDNEALIKLKSIRDGVTLHHYDPAYSESTPALDGTQLFYRAITNPQISGQSSPYNKESYILISAGYDGIFGTTDDVTNFGNQ